MSVNQFIEMIKSISVENLSDNELDLLKDEVIKLLVDIQVQKDINKKISEAHTSTDDIQIQIMQKTEDVSVVSDRQEASRSTKVESNPTDNDISEYQKVINEPVSDELLSIYHTSSSSTQKEQSTTTSIDKGVESSGAHIVSKISFSINDRFRIIKKLFYNNTQEYELFIRRLNEFNEYTDAQKYIVEYAQQQKWDENLWEYQTLIKQNQKRFKL